MLIYIILLICLCFWRIQFSSTSSYDIYLQKNTTDAVKGVFILIVFLGHIKNYILEAGYIYAGIGDVIFAAFFSCLGQLVVVMFLFYSGFGVMERISTKELDYVKNIPKHRILATLINFDVAVCIFAIVNLLIGDTYSMQKYILSLLCWESLGNSNWYIFIIIICYLVTYLVSIKMVGRSLMTIVLGVFIILTCVAIALYFIKEPWWYNTIWAYPTGMLYSIYRKDIDAIVNNKYEWKLFVIFSILFLCYFIPSETFGLRTNIMSVFFAIFVVVLTMRVRVGNPILQWCGRHLFPFYIYQRIPMIAIASIFPKLPADIPILYIAICLIITVVITYCYKFIKITI